LVVFGDKDEHLDLLDGVLIDLLKIKWNTFGKAKFYRQFYFFFAYFLVALVGFTLRNGPVGTDDAASNSTSSELRQGNLSAAINTTIFTNTTELYPQMPEDAMFGLTSCPAFRMDGVANKVRNVAEVGCFIGSLMYILVAFRESRFLGSKMFFENLMTAPSRVMFLFACFLTMIVPFLKFLCLTELEDHIVVIIMLTTAPYFLFFCR
jgi:hypothetical protein